MATNTFKKAPWARKHDSPGVPVVPSADEILFPHTLADVIELCRSGGHLMAAGSHWALSTAAISDERFVETHDPNNGIPAMGRTLREVVPGCLTHEFLKSLATVDPLPFAPLSPVDTTSSYLVHFETGKRVFQLYAELDLGEEKISDSLAYKLDKDYGNPNYAGPWAFETSGAAGGQTVFGALTTGTHGGDFVSPPMADFVEAMHLVADGGDHYWIERTPGHIQMTDDAALRAVYDDGRTRFHIIRDTQLFNAVLVGAGRFGIVYSIVMRVVRQYMLHEDRVLTTWEDVRPLISDLTSPLYSTQFLQLAVSATPHGNFQRHLCGQTKRSKIPFVATPGSNAPIGRAERRGPVVSPADPQIGGPRFRFAGNSRVFSPDPAKPGIALAPSFLEVACSDADFMHGVLTQVASEIEEFLEDNTVVAGTALAAVAVVGGIAVLATLAAALLFLLALLLLFIDELEKADNSTLGKVIDDLRGFLLEHDDPDKKAAGILMWQMIVQVLWAERQGDLTFDAISYAVLDRHDYLDQSCDVNVDSIEVFFAADDPMLLAFVDALLVFEVFQNNATGRAFSGYISLRFTGKTEALVGMERFERSCAVEVAGLKDVSGTIEMIDFALTLARNPNFGGILHWGQRNPSTMAEIQDRFGDKIGGPSRALGSWRRALGRITDNGRLDRFSSAFTRRVGLEIVAPRIGNLNATITAGEDLRISWSCTANPPATLVFVRVKRPDSTVEILNNLPLSGQQTIPNTAAAGGYVAKLIAIIILNGEARHATTIENVEVP